MMGSNSESMDAVLRSNTIDASLRGVPGMSNDSGESSKVEPSDSYLDDGGDGGVSDESVGIFALLPPGVTTDDLGGGESAGIFTLLPPGVLTTDDLLPPLLFPARFAEKYTWRMRNSTSSFPLSSKVVHSAPPFIPE